MERQINSGNYKRRCSRKFKRKSKRRKAVFYRVVCIVLCFLLAAAVYGTVNWLRDSKEPSILSKENTKTSTKFSQMNSIMAANVIVVNKDTDEVLYQKNDTDKIAPASTAKMITALTVLDYCSPDDEMRVGAEIDMIHEDSSRAWLMRGDILTVRQLLIALMLPSGNDAAYTLAVNTGKNIAGDNSLKNKQSIDVFMDKVNEKAMALGAVNSNFLVPDGYDTEGQYTTAYDLAMIAKACLDQPVISEIVSSYTSYEKWSNGRAVTYNNTNELLNPDSPYYRPEVIGLKTGSSSLAGDCIVSAAVIEGETYICVVMRSTEERRFQDSIDILEKIYSE